MPSIYLDEKNGSNSDICDSGTIDSVQPFDDHEISQLTDSFSKPDPHSEAPSPEKMGAVSPGKMAAEAGQSPLDAPTASNSQEAVMKPSVGDARAFKETPMVSLVRHARRTARGLLAWSAVSTFLAFLVRELR